MFERGVEQVFLAAGEIVFERAPVQDHAHLGAIGGIGDHRRVRARLGRGLGGREDFHLDGVLGHAVLDEHVAGFFHHVERPAHERAVDIRRVDPVREQLLDLGAVDPAVEQIDIELFAAHDIDQIEAPEIAILQVGQLLAKQHAARGAVAVEQREPAVRLGHERGLDDRQQRRDATARAEGDIVLVVVFGQRKIEAPGRRHDLDRLARRQFVVGPVRELAARHALDRDPQLFVLYRRTHRIGTTDFLAVDLGAQGQVLALGIGKGVAQFVRHVEGDHDRIAVVALDGAHGQRMELRHAIGTCVLFEAAAALRAPPALFKRV